MKDDNLYFSLTGTGHYYGTEPIRIGALFCCEKQPDNKYDSEAIRAMLPLAGTIGYIANSTHTVVHGTSSAGRLYDKVPDLFFARVLFKTSAWVICRVETEAPDLLQLEMSYQMEALQSIIQKFKTPGVKQK